MGDIVALDQGTTSSRALRFDPSGALKALKQREFEQHFPEPGWVEHDPQDLWQTQVAVLEEVLTPDVEAIGISNQRETTLLWERDTGRPLHRAIVWQDRRTAPLLASMEALAPLVRERTGLLLDPYFSAAKLRWLLDEVPGARGRAERGELAFGTVDSWLIWNLTKGAVHATDVTNASRTSLFDIHKRQWDAELLDAFAIPPSLLPDVRESASDFGEYKGIEIRGVAGDQQAALFGQGCVEAGMAKCTYGTGCFLLMHTGDVAERSPHLLTTLTCDGGYALEGSVFMGGAIVGWLRQGLGIIESASEIEALAGSVESSEGVFFVPAFTGLGAPHWDPHARAAILGLNRGSKAAHIARAALEAIALQVAELVDRPLSELRADGAAARDDLLMQLQADQLGTPLLCPQLAESSALGAARLAGLTPAAWQAGRRFEPQISRDEAASKLARWQEAVAAVRAFH